MLKIVALLSLLCSLSNAAQLSLFPKLRHVQHRTASKSILPQARESIKSRFEALIASNDTEYEYAQVCTSSEVSSVNSCIENVFLFELDCNSTAEYAAKLLRCIEVYCNAECEDNKVFFEEFYAFLNSLFEEYIGVCEYPGACDAVNSVVDDPTAAPTFEDIGGNGTEYEGNYSEYEYGGNTDVCLNGNLSGFNKCMSEIYPYEYEYGGEYEYGREYEYGIDNCVFINTFFLDNLHCLEVSCATSCTDIEPIIVNALEFYNELLNCTFDLSCDQFTTAPTASPTVSPTAHLTPITLPVTDTLRFLFILVAFCLVVVILLIIVIVLLCQSRRRQTQLTVLEGSNEEKKAFKQKEMEAKELL